MAKRPKTWSTACNQRSTAERLFGPFDDLVLQLFAEVVEMVAIAGDPDNQVLILVRMILCVDQRLPVDDVELDVVAVQAEIGTNQRGHVFQAPVAGNDGRDEFLVEESPAGL